MRQITADTAQFRSPSFDNDEFEQSMSVADEHPNNSRRGSAQEALHASTQSSPSMSSSKTAPVGAASTHGQGGPIRSGNAADKQGNMTDFGSQGGASFSTQDRSPRRVLPIHPQGTPPRKQSDDPLFAGASPGTNPALGASWKFQGGGHSASASAAGPWPQQESKENEPLTWTQQPRLMREFPEDRTRGGERIRPRAASPSTPRIGSPRDDDGRDVERRKEGRMRRDRQASPPAVNTSLIACSSPSSAASPSTIKTPTSMADMIRQTMPPTVQDQQQGKGTTPSSSAAEPQQQPQPKAYPVEVRTALSSSTPLIPTMPGPRPLVGAGSLVPPGGPKAAAIPKKKPAVGEGRTQIGFVMMMEGNKRPEQRRVPRAEVALHNKRSDCWIIFNKQVYDVTPYMPYHPGGKSVVAQYAGKDGTAAFLEAHPWVSIDGLLSKCCLGPVCD